MDELNLKMQRISQLRSQIQEKKFYLKQLRKRTENRKKEPFKNPKDVDSAIIREYLKKENRVQHSKIQRIRSLCVVLNEASEKP